MKNILNKEIKYSLSLLFMLINLFGCGSVSQESVLMKNVEDAKMNSAELALIMNEITGRYSLAIENSADKIISESKDVNVKKNALLWKMYGIPALFRTTSIQDPLASGIDTYIFIAQMHQFFENGYGKNLFGKHQQIAINTTKKMEIEFFGISSRFRDSSSITKSKVDEWVKTHPIENIRFNRVSSVTESAKVLSQKKLSLTASIGDMVSTMDNLQNKLTLNAEFIPKEARWQAEYLIYELLADSMGGNLFENVNSLTGSVERISRFIENSPELISYVRQKLMQDINTQRIATLESLKEEKMTILEAVTSERINTLKEIDRERLETLSSVEKLADKSITSSGLMLVNVADKILIRLVILLFITFILGLVFIRVVKGKVKLN